MRTCPNCGEENPERFRLCGFCGTPLAPELPPQEVRKTVTVDALSNLCDQRRQFDHQARLHYWLHNWLWIHLPLSLALIVLMFVHIVRTLQYWWPS